MKLGTLENVITMCALYAKVRGSHDIPGLKPVPKTSWSPGAASSLPSPGHYCAVGGEESQVAKSFDNSVRLET